KAGLFTLAVIGVVTSVVGAYYYLAIVKTMYFDDPAKAFEPTPHELGAVLGVTGLFNLLFFVYPAPLIDAANAAARSLFWEPQRPLNETRPERGRGGRAAPAPRGARLDQCGSLAPGAPRRARPALGHRRAADGGPRPARTGLDIAGRQSLCE